MKKKLLKRCSGKNNSTFALLYLLHRIIFHNCSDDFHFRGNINDLKKIPPHKSLFKIPQGKGLPIGNLTPQFFANVYLNELDQYVKHVLKCKFYIRYVDDFVIISNSEEQLVQWKKQIVSFLADKLALEIKSGSRSGRVSDGIDFLGYITRPML